MPTINNCQYSDPFGVSQYGYGDMLAEATANKGRELATSASNKCKQVAVQAKNKCVEAATQATEKVKTVAKEALDASVQYVSDHKKEFIFGAATAGACTMGPFTFAAAAGVGATTSYKARQYTAKVMKPEHDPLLPNVKTDKVVNRLDFAMAGVGFIAAAAGFQFGIALAGIAFANSAFRAIRAAVN